MSSSVLVVAFDGMDKSLIQERNLSSIKQNEFGYIDNHTDIHKIKTSELFASFLTGTTYESHSIKGVSPYPHTIRGELRDVLIPNYLKENIRGFFRLDTAIGVLLGLDTMHYSASDI